MTRALTAILMASAAFGLTLAADTATAKRSADAEPDGAITRAAAMAQADARFAEIDGNKDGRLSSDELAASRPTGRGGIGPGAGLPTPPPADASAPGAGGAGAPGRGMFARLDGNGDGTVSPDEYRALAARRFDRLDTNGDSTVDQAERQTARDAMRARRRNGPDGDPPPAPRATPAPGY